MKRLSGLAAVVLAATTLAPTGAAAAPVPPTQLVTDWIAGELTGGLAVGQFGADVGLSIDAGLALEATGRLEDARLVGEAIADRLVATGPADYGYVRSDEYNYVEPYEFKQVGSYANATAKAAAFTQRIGRDAATQYAAVNLVAQLEGLTDDTTGLIADDSFYGNYANTIGQAFAVEALTAADSGESQNATEALLDQQCPAGYFRFGLDAAACAADTADQAPDTTGIAVLSLLESGNTSPDVTAAIAEATSWLESVQLADGSWGGDSSAPGSNSNSTGLAGWALGRAGREAAASKAAAWVRSMQVADAGACISQAPTGAIAYNSADLAADRASGLGGNRDKWRRASFQAAPVLAWAPVAGTPLSISTPATAVEKGSVTAIVRGVAPGEQACVHFGNDARGVVGTGSDLTVDFTLPAGATAHTFTLTTLNGTATSTTSATAVPAPTTPAPTAPTPSPAVPIVGDLAASRTERVRNNVFALAVECDSAQTCAGKLKVRSVHELELANGTTRRVLVAKREYSVAPDTTVRIKLRLTRPARAVLGSKRLRVAAVQSARGAESATTTFWLRRR